MLQSNLLCTPPRGCAEAACLTPAVLQAAYVVCRGSRGQLRMAADEVQRQLKIITSTRKKQHAMELLDVLSRVKKVKDLPAALRSDSSGRHDT